MHPPIEDTLVTERVCGFDRTDVDITHGDPFFPTLISVTARLATE
jgi:hypothetical protein